MNTKILYAVLALGLLAPAGPALAWHPANDPSVGYNVETLDQAHAAYVAAHPQVHAFAPRAFPTREDFETVTLAPQHPSRGIGGSVPWNTYQLKEPGRFTFELQRMDEVWLTLGVGY